MNGWLDGQYFDWGEVVLLAADFAVVFGGGFEEFVAAVGGEGAHAVSGGLHGFRVDLVL